MTGQAHLPNKNYTGSGWQRFEGVSQGGKAPLDGKANPSFCVTGNQHRTDAAGGAKMKLHHPNARAIVHPLKAHGAELIGKALMNCFHLIHDFVGQRFGLIYAQH